MFVRRVISLIPWILAIVGVGAVLYPSTMVDQKVAANLAFPLTMDTIAIFALGLTEYKIVSAGTKFGAGVIVSVFGMLWLVNIDVISKTDQGLAILVLTLGVDKMIANLGFFKPDRFKTITSVFSIALWTLMGIGLFSMNNNDPIVTIQSADGQGFLIMLLGMVFLTVTMKVYNLMYHPHQA